MYLSDQNSLAEFVAKYATPYDAETDTYERPAFAADIKEGKNDPIYNAHSYHTKVPPRAIIPYILHYTQPGDLLLDPFCGSGMTGVAAMMCSAPPEDLLEQFPDLKGRVGPRRAILNDLAPAACHIASNFCTPVDVASLKHEFERIKSEVKKEFDWLYGTEHYEPALGIYAPAQIEVAGRLKTCPPDVSIPEATQVLTDPNQQTWELVNRGEVEKRLGYAVQKLSFKHRADLPEDFSASTVDRWVVIPATIQYTIWSDVYRCDGRVTVEEPAGKMSTRGKNAGKPMMRTKRVARGCHGEIVLWDVGVDPDTGKVSDEFLCPHCRQEWRKIDLPRTGTRPVAMNLSFTGLRRKKSEVQPALLDYDRPQSYRDMQRLDEIVSQPLSTWVPDIALNPQDPQYTRNALGGRKITTVKDFFTPRNLRALSGVFARIEATEDFRLQNALKFVFTSTFNGVTRATRYRFKTAGNGAITGTLYIPSFAVEANPLGLLCRKVEDCCKAFSTRSQHTGSLASIQAVD